MQAFGDANHHCTCKSLGFLGGEVANDITGAFGPSQAVCPIPASAMLLAMPCLGTSYE